MLGSSKRIGEELGKWDKIETGLEVEKRFPQILEDVGGNFTKALEVKNIVIGNLGATIFSADDLVENWQELL